MTENTPSGPAGPEPTPPSDRPEQGPSQPSPWSPAGYAGAASSADPGTGEHTAATGYATGEQPTAASATPGHPGYAGPGVDEQPTASYGGYPPPPGPGYPHPTQQQPLYGPPPASAPPKAKGRAGVIAGIAALALVVGGAAGGGVGYLVANDTGSTAYSSLDQSEPASQAAAPAGTVAAVSQKVLPSVVEIAAVYAQNGQAAGDTGSGIIISSDGDILTNNHVVAGAANGGKLQVVLNNGTTVDAGIIGRDPTSDLAVIKAKGLSGLPTAQLGRSDDLQVGQQVAAIGAPFQLQGTVTAGIVSSLHRATAAGDGGDSQTTVMDAIQTDAPINPGNSGGPLVNMQGQVIGINSATYSPSTGQQGGGQASNIGIGFAIPIDQAKRTADQIVKTGSATQTVLGVKVEDSTPTQGGQSILTNGALISDVTAGGPAAKAGLKTGSVVTKADDRLITNADDLVAAVHAASPGDQLKLTLAGGSTVTVTLAGQTVQAN